jgi:hypothetical protein
MGRHLPATMKILKKPPPFADKFDVRITSRYATSEKTAVLKHVEKIGLFNFSARNMNIVKVV